MSRPAGARGTVSVVVVDDHPLTGSLEGTLDALSTPDLRSRDLEVVLVTPREGADLVRPDDAAAATQVVAIDPTEPASARNRGAEAAGGEWLAFLGAGHQPGPDWLEHALEVLDTDTTVVCVASSVVDPAGAPAWDPAVSYLGHPVPGPVGTETASGVREVLYASRDAMVVRADAFVAAGGFDPRFEQHLDDVDLGWRLWLGGGRVVQVGASTVRRVVARPDQGVEGRFLRDRNALFTLFKNYDDASLAAALPIALGLGVHRAARDGADPDPVAATAAAAPSDELVASARAVDAFVRALPGLHGSRRQVQERRVRSDMELRRLLVPPPRPSGDHGVPTPEEVAAEALGAREQFGERRRILVATCDTLTAKMAGPAIRAWQVAAALAAEHDVQLVTTNRATITDPRFRVRAVDDRELAELEQWCDVLVFQGWVITGRPFLLSSDKVLVADIYDPLHLEQLEQGRDGSEESRRAAVRNSTEVLNEQLLRGDFFLCANSKQRDFWLGQLAALGRINTSTYDEDATLESLIAVVPFGISDRPPEHTRPAVKGVFPGIGPDDAVILWGGGVYNWFDPLTLVRAVDRLRHRHPSVRLLFMGLRHPNPDIPEMRMAVATRALAEELGLAGTHVFFNEEWVEYADRQNYLLEADVGVSTHLAHLETALSSRTRILDYVWARLPVVATEGDVLADLVASRELGLTVPPGDVDALEDALFRLLDDEGFAKTCRENAAAVARELAWSRVLEPLVEFCRRPRRAPDLLDQELARHLRTDLTPPPRPRGWRNDLGIGIRHLREGGPVLLATKAWDRLRRRLS